MKDQLKKKNPHAVSIGSLGGQAKFKKYKSDGMSQMAKIRWDKYRAEKQLEN